MVFEQKWTGSLIKDGKVEESFPVSVPGQIQRDYAAFKDFGDLNFMDNCKKYLEIEDYFWSYETEIVCDKKENERVFFVTHGIEYEYDVLLNGRVLTHHEGMFTRVESDITDELENGRRLEILIYPHPKRQGAPEGRTMADQSVKPADEYGWDWAPRVLLSGLWDKTYIETRTPSYVNSAEPFYTLSSDLKSADIHFEIDCAAKTHIEITDMDGACVYSGSDRDIHLDNIKLWWCNGQGTPYLYSWRVSSEDSEKSGRIGFKRVRLVMNEDAWREPSRFPKSRSVAPATIELNGRRIFAKGSNFVNPEVFTASITNETYENLVDLAADANMNIFRCWGGAIIPHDAFFDRCDERGIMVWSEFPLACNNYVGTDKYLATLKQEATAIIKRLRSRACHVLWCGGNELFNSWSKMTDQSHALRLLDKLCYEHDFSKPFNKTSPVFGMAHGHYEFANFNFDGETDGVTVFEMFAAASNTAYTEFSVSAISGMEQLRKIFTDDVIFDLSQRELWSLHHGYNSWRKTSWLGKDVTEYIFGSVDGIEDAIEKTNFLKCEGLKFIFEEARRQWGHCSMALNWCFDEPWVTAAGHSLIGYPSVKTPAYYAVKDALRDRIPSARIEHFKYKKNQTLRADLYLLNDSPEAFSDTVNVYITVDGEKRFLLTWEAGKVKANSNISGPTVNFIMPDTETQVVTLTLEASCGTSEYRVLLYNPKKPPKNPNILNF